MLTPDKNNASPQAPPISEDDRRRFLRKSLCGAQMEFSSLESSLKIIESALLTAMGTLGAVCGFNGMLRPEANGIKVVGRGMDGAALAWIEDNFQNLVDQYVGALETSADAFHSEIRILTQDPPHCPGPLAGARIRILAAWRMGHTPIGLMGLGVNIKEAPFLDSEIDFLYNLMDHMMLEIRAVGAKSVIHTLENELDQARQRVAEYAVRNEASQKELEEARFRLSGFNDIFHELSGLRETDKVLDAFLLVMLGIFSAHNGTILYWDDSTRKAHTIRRGCEEPTGSDAIKEKLELVFGSRQSAKLGVMQATMMPSELLKSLHLFSPPGSVAVVFKVDQGARGVLCLGKRLVETQYGVQEQELLLAFTHTFLAFLKDSSSFETIERLNAGQKQKNIELEKTVRALSESRRTIAGLERAGERIKAAIVNVISRTTRLSIMDVALILFAGTALGLVYNYASPSGIPIVPQIWRYPPAPQNDIDNTKALLDAEKIILIDARPVEFYHQGHIPGALNLPLALFDFVYMMRFSQFDAEQPIVVYGRNISRHYDAEVAFKLTERGHPNVSILSGGLNAWQARGFASAP
jgi:rhodanese-related sulfurtransferase